MADPTEYDLVQDARLDAHEALITPQPKTRSEPWYSFPIVGQDISDDEFRQMMIAVPSGIADEGGRPFWWANLDDLTNTMQLTVSKTTGDAKAAMSGFFFRMTQDVTISLPPVSVATDYYVCLTYDPLGHSRPEGPISVVTYRGEPPTTGGRSHIVCWVVSRKPSQLLSDITPTQVRPKVAPQLTVDTAEQLPDPSSVLWGTTCVVTYGEHAGSIWQADGSDPEKGRPKRWDNVTNPPWKNVNVSGSVNHSTRPLQYRFKDGCIEFRGGVVRKSGEFPRYDMQTIGWLPRGVKAPWFVAAATSNAGRTLTVYPRQGGSNNSDLCINVRESGCRDIWLDGIRIPLE